MDAIFFCMVLVSTVGYGANLTPGTPPGRVFCVLFTVAGLFVFGSMAKTIGIMVHAVTPTITKWVRCSTA